MHKHRLEADLAGFVARDLVFSVGRQHSHLRNKQEEGTCTIPPVSFMCLGMYHVSGVMQPELGRFTRCGTTLPAGKHLGRFMQ